MLLLMKTSFKENISPITIEHSSQLIDHLDKPSNNCHAKTEFILKALEDIASSLSMEINREILWSQLKQKCKSDESFRFEVSRNKNIIEKITKNSWDKEGLKVHMDRVIAWHKQNYPQLYSHFDQK